MKTSVIAPTLLACLMSAALTYARPLTANFDLAARDVAESPYDALYIRDIETELLDLETRDLLKKRNPNSSSTQDISVDTNGTKPGEKSNIRHGVGRRDVVESPYYAFSARDFEPELEVRDLTKKQHPTSKPGRSKQSTDEVTDVDVSVDTNGPLPGGKENIDLKIDDPQQQSRPGPGRRGGRRGNGNGGGPNPNGRGQQHPQHERSHSSHGVGPRDVVESPYYAFSARDFEPELEVRDLTKKQHPTSKPGRSKQSTDEVTDVDVSVDTNGPLPGGKENIDLKIDDPQQQSRPGPGRRGGRRGNVNGGGPNPNGRGQQHPQHERSHTSHGVGPRDVVESPYYAFSARDFEPELEVRDLTKKQHPTSKPGRSKQSTDEVTDVDVSVDTNGPLPGGKENIDLKIDDPQQQSRPGPGRRGGRRGNGNGNGRGPNPNGRGQQHPQPQKKSTRRPQNQSKPIHDQSQRTTGTNSKTGASPNVPAPLDEKIDITV